jgi:hypothetical protein
MSPSRVGAAELSQAIYESTEATARKGVATSSSRHTSPCLYETQQGKGKGEGQRAFPIVYAKIKTNVVSPEDRSCEAAFRGGAMAREIQRERVF